MENLGIFYDHLVYFTAVGNILWPFCYFFGLSVYFPCFGILYQEKSDNPAQVCANVTTRVGLKFSTFPTSGDREGRGFGGRRDRGLARNNGVQRSI
jgi:hypothetical protein